MQNQHLVEEISLADICLNRETQVRASVDEETIIRYFDVMVDVEARDKFPPVTLFRDENGNLWLADGHHRIMAALRRKFHSILAVVRPGTKEDAIWEAVSANSRNGLPLGRADVRRAVIMVLESFPNKSLRSIAENVGCSKSYVEKVKAQVSTSGHLTEPTQVEGKDGKQYPSKKNKKSETTSVEPAPVATATPDDSPTMDEAVMPNESSPMDVVAMPTEPDETTPATPDDVVIAKAKAGEERIFDMIEALNQQLIEWYSSAPSELHKDFDERLRKRIGELIN